MKLERISALLTILQQPEEHPNFSTANLISLKKAIDSCLENNNNDFTSISNWFKANKNVRDYLDSFAQNRAKFKIPPTQPSDDAEIKQNLMELSTRISEIEKAKEQEQKETSN